MLALPNSRPLGPLKGLPGVYLVIDADIFGPPPEADELRRDTFKALETILQNGRVPVLPALEELELTEGHPVLTLSANHSQEGGIVFCGIALQLTEEIRLIRDPYTTCTAITWSQIGKFIATEQEFWQSLGQAMQVLFSMFIEDYRTANGI